MSSRGNWLGLFDPMANCRVDASHANFYIVALSINAKFRNNIAMPIDYLVEGVEDSLYQKINLAQYGPSGSDKCNRGKIVIRIIFIL